MFGPLDPGGVPARPALAICHRLLADRFAQSDPLRSMTRRNPCHRWRSDAILNAPDFIVNYDDIAVAGQALVRCGVILVSLNRLGRSPHIN